MPIDYHDIHLKGTFWAPTRPSFSRTEPGPEADAAWYDLETKSPDVFPTARADVLTLSNDPKKVACFVSFGLDPDAYVASLDALHKPHCLNEIRKMTSEDYGEATPTKKKHGELW